ncbi:CCA tRNA nucleotidyltransferase [Hyphococcus flavus]|uniref:CCA tRNA nucleotidyltransferase n=1 Tax=Hyphococcus flavus TaxID=1866326 RepID=A0AAF0CGA8_9PROT|nr:CCA tRNA nucleotidyltransferase [Hyphococcus flavus]WDI30447.1 CCA tRNA nucleotidyltransferase [Hyphococcus flavus]
MTAQTDFFSIPIEARERFNWISAPHLKTVVSALEAAAPDGARFVGGCVRDSLLGETPKDFDIATILEPEEATRALKKAGLRVAPTGIDHGTVTAIVEHQGVEVTSLRADVSTDGRRATVAFTNDWSVDAHRRDFTVNAIYLTSDGRLYDPTGGIDDARRRRIRFIGSPEARIKEDYLRILRFFRFSARFCDHYDEAGLEACARLRAGIQQLSAERVGLEFTSILSLPRAVFALEAMYSSGVLKEIWQEEPDLEAATRMKLLSPTAHSALMLAALYGDEGAGIGSRLRLSNAEKSGRTTAIKTAEHFAPNIEQKDLKTILYTFGRDNAFDGALLATARGVLSPDKYRRIRLDIESMVEPVFFISGRHVVDAGVQPGPPVAKILAAVEAQWILEGFPDESRQQAILRDKITQALV